MNSLTIIGIAFFVMIAGGLILNHTDDPTEEIVEEDLTWYYFIERVPNISITKDTIYNAVASWEELNPGLEFEEVVNPDDATITIKWVESIEHLYDVTGISRTTITEMSDGSQYWYTDILIDYTDLDCNKLSIYWENDTMEDTIRHEIGHAIGISDHSNNEDNLMYDPDDGMDIINDWGYVIPELKTQIPFYIGEEEAMNEMDILFNEFETVLAGYGYTEADWDRGIDSDNDMLFSEVNAIIIDLNQAVDKNNCYIEN